MKKKLLSVLLAILLVCTTALPAFATGKPQLSAMSDEEILAFVADAGITIPDYLINVEDFIRSQITAIEQRPTIDFNGVNYLPTKEFLESLRSAVNAYYGTVTPQQSRVVVDNHALVQSTVYSSWSTSYNNYNCYAYAVYDTTAWRLPGDYYNLYETNETDRIVFSLNYSSYMMAQCIVADLEALGYTATASTTMPSPSAWSNVICVRKDNENNADFHVMRYSYGTGKWQHKPGRTIPLLLKYSNAAFDDWLAEWCLPYDELGVELMGYLNDSIKYNSTIYYIAYK